MTEKKQSKTKKKESKILIMVAVKEGNIRTRGVFDENSKLSDISLALTYLELMKKKLLGLVEAMSKKNS